MKVFIPTLPLLIKDSSSPSLQLSSLKAFGTFATQASMIPIRMQSFYRDIIENKILIDVISIIASVGSVATPL